jgi:hypothetical protein
VEATRFLYSMGVQMGTTGLLTRGTVNIARAASNTINDVGSRIGKLFGQQDIGLGAKGIEQNASIDTLLLRAIGGDKDGVKLAKYLQQKYEKTFNPNIPMIGGQTPTQLLGSALGFGTDLTATKGISAPAEGALTAAKTLPAAAQTVLNLGAKAGITGAMGIARGAVAGAINKATEEVKAPLEGAVDFAHGITNAVISTGELFGQWAAADLAFGALGKSAAEGLSHVGTTVIKSILGRGTAGLPKAGSFAVTADGELTPKAQALQRQFIRGNASPEALKNIGPATDDWFASYRDVHDALERDPKALEKDPVLDLRQRAQAFMGGQNSVVGISMNPDGTGTWRLRQAPGKGSEILAEHQTLPEAEMTIHNEWENEIALARENYNRWNARYEKYHTDNDLNQMQSAQMHLRALQDRSPMDREIRDSLTIIEGLQNRIAPEGAAKLPSEGAMLTYGEASSLQGHGLNVAHLKLSLDDSAMDDIAKRGALVNSDKPTRFTTVSGGDYNGAILYSNAAPDAVYQATLARTSEMSRAGVNASGEDLALSSLRDQGYDAIKHDNGDVTALYPRQQIKHVSDMVSKTSREYVRPAEPTPVASTGEAIAKSESYTAPSMLTTDHDKFDWLMEASHREGNTVLRPTPRGDYQLIMDGKVVAMGSVDSVTDDFLARSTTPSHLRASLESEGMSLKYDGKQYSITGSDGKSLGTGVNPYEAMQAARYRPKLIDGRFGPQNVEITPEGSTFEYTPTGVRGPLSDVVKYNNSFMDVAEEEGKRIVDSNKTGKIAQGHDGAYTVEIPAWGIREKFSSATESKEYLSGRYKEYDNVQRLANERGFSFTYEAGKGYVLRGTTGTYSVNSMDDIGKVLATKPDARWAPESQYSAGVTMKDSADAIKRPADTAFNNRNTGKLFADKNALGQWTSSFRSWVTNTFAQKRSAFSRAEVEHGYKDLSRRFVQVQHGEIAGANQTMVDTHKINSIFDNYNLTPSEKVVVDKVMGAVTPEAVNDTLNHFGVPIDSPKRFQILDCANQLHDEVYKPIFSRSGMDPQTHIERYSSKHLEYKAQHPEQYRDMELTGPAGMRQLIKATNGDRVPEDMRFQALHERVADWDGILKEENAQAKAILYAQAANRWAYMAEPMRAFVERLHQGDITDPRILDLGHSYINEALSMGSSDAMDMIRLQGRAGGTLVKAPVMSWLKTMAGAGAYGLKTGSALHIAASSYAQATGFLGTEATNAGFRVSEQGGVEHVRELFQRGVFTARAPITGGFGDSSMGSSFFAQASAKMAQASTFFLQNAHILAKSAVYDAASWLFDKHMKPFVDSGMKGDFDMKAHDIKDYLLDQGASDQWRSLLGNDYEAARHGYAINMTDQITYQWRPEDQGNALSKGSLAKLWGQLMVMPTSYAASLGRLASKGSVIDRVGNLATYGKNTALLYGAERLAGLSGANVLPWRVIGLKGGPLWQDMTNLMQQPDSKKLDFALKALENMAPTAWVIQGIQVVKELQNENPWGALLTFGGASTTPSMRPQAQKAFERIPPIPQIRQASKWLGNTFSFLNPPKQ